jgi:methylated-DNA-[protein]-cysteine S-methyltransferase
MLRSTVVDSPLGPVTLVASDAGLRAVRFDHTRWPAVEPPRDHAEPGADDPVLVRAAAWFDAYLAGEEVAASDLPLDLGGLTDFQRQVVAAMRGIPYGRLETYGDLARRTGDPNASRAVGRACNRNRLPIVVPCHRVVAADGSLGGYAAGTDAKRALLRHERGVAVPLGGWEPATAPEPDMPRLFDV